MQIKLPFRYYEKIYADILIDEQFWDLHKHKQWKVLGIPNKDNVANYVIHGEPNNNPEYMHVSVFKHFSKQKNIPHGYQIDHHGPYKTIDNRYNSLRMITQQQNLASRRPPKRKQSSTSEYKGVSLNKKTLKWVCEFNSKEQIKKRLRTTCMPTQADAAILYNLFVNHFQPKYGYKNTISKECVRQMTDKDIYEKYKSMIVKHKKCDLIIAK